MYSKDSTNMKGIIYMIINWVDNETFIGSTTKPLQERMQMYQNTYQLTPQRKLHHHMNKLGIDQFGIIEIESLEVDSVLQLLEREKYYIKKYNPSLNRGRTEKEKEATKRDKILASQKAYYERNKVEMLAKMKVQRQQNSEVIAARKHEYYEKHKDEFNARRAAAKVTCGCGGRYCYNNRTIHDKTAKHQTWLKYQKN